jgi:hypothetical protein
LTTKRHQLALLGPKQILEKRPPAWFLFGSQQQLEARYILESDEP